MDDTLVRMWDDMVARIGGPMGFRLAAVPYALLSGVINRPARLWPGGANPPSSMSRAA
jgi:hypothetical protein